MFEKYRADAPSQKIRMTARFCFSHPCHTIASFLGAGALRPGPGTWGTLAAALVFALYAPFVSFRWQCLIGIVTFVVGIIASEITGKNIGVKDHGGIVIDRVAAIWLLFPFLPPRPWAWVAGFVLFRFFDIVKIWPVSWMDKKIPGGLGVMVDDLWAALYAGLTFYLGVKVFL